MDQKSEFKKLNVLLIEMNRELGGSIFATLKLANELDRIGCNVLLVISRNSNWEHLLKLGELPYYKIDGWPGVKRIEAIMTLKKRIIKIFKDAINRNTERKIEKIINDHKIDIIHISTLIYQCGAKAAKRKGKKLIWHIREFLQEDHGHDWIDREKSIRLLNSADKVITVSDAVFKKYKPFVSSDKICRIYDGIEIKKYFCERIPLQNSIIKCGILGRIISGKGQQEFIMAAKHCTDLPIEFHIIGSGNQDYMAELKNLAYYNAPSKLIYFDGFTDTPDKLMKEMDIMCICSRSEAFGLVTIEAMTAGCIVIGADSGGTKELISDGKTGLLYRQGDSRDLADRIRWVTYNKTICREIAKNGQQYIAENFTTERNALQVYRIYHNVLAGEENIC